MIYCYGFSQIEFFREFSFTMNRSSTGRGMARLVAGGKGPRQRLTGFARKRCGGSAAHAGIGNLEGALERERSSMRSGSRRRRGDRMRGDRMRGSPTWRLGKSSNTKTDDFQGSFTGVPALVNDVRLYDERRLD